MSEAQVAGSPASAARQQRVSAENRYPIYDLQSGVELARAVKERGGNGATLAYRVMMDSAEAAGFFAAHAGQRTHLVDPGSGAISVSQPPATQDKREENGGGGGHNGGNGGDGLQSRGKLLDGMWEA